MEVYLGLGSNLGDRESNLNEALERLDNALETNRTKVSDFIETKAWGFDGADFMNAVVRYDLDIKEDEVQERGLELLDVCKAIEREMGRTGEPEYDADGGRIYKDRPVDIDILLMGDCTVSHPRLTVPHPLMWEREFVMIPLSQIRMKTNK